MSRSVLAEHLRQYLDEPPMSYLTRWRLQLGAQMLNTSSYSSYSIAQIAAEVGYESEVPAFNRAFKREFNLPPARFRAEAKSGPGQWEDRRRLQSTQTEEGRGEEVEPNFGSPITRSSPCLGGGCCPSDQSDHRVTSIQLPRAGTISGTVLFVAR